MLFVVEQADRPAAVASDPYEIVLFMNEAADGRTGALWTLAVDDVVAIRELRFAQPDGVARDVDRVVVRAGVRRGCGSLRRLEQLERGGRRVGFDLDRALRVHFRVSDDRLGSVQDDVDSHRGAHAGATARAADGGRARGRDVLHFDIAARD